MASKPTKSQYNTLMQKYIRALGSPPRFTQQVDPYYTNDMGAGTGRAMSKTWFSNPSILSICPGTVDYLPGFNKKEKDKVTKINSILSSILKVTFILPS